jgi:TRAP-type mannitol/chloroaromatic compound transport system permease small subunit
MGARALRISFQTGEYFSGSHLTIPAWPGKLMMPLGFGALAIQLLADILQDVLKLSKYGKEQSQ